MIEEVSHKYNDKTHCQSRIAKEVWDIMQNVTKRTITSINEKSFEKLLGIANHANSVDFLD